jgi:CRP-like cAMP-binding protein
MEHVNDLQSKKTLIKKQALFAQFTDQELDELAELFAETRFKKGDTIVTEGDHVDSVFLIVEGTAEVVHIAIENDKKVSHHIANLGPNQSIGLNETGFFSISGLRTATVVASTDMVLLRLSVAKFHGFELSHSHVYDIMHKAANRKAE